MKLVLTFIAALLLGATSNLNAQQANSTATGSETNTSNTYTYTSGVTIPAAISYVVYKHDKDLIMGSPGTLTFSKDTAVFLQFTGFSQIPDQTASQTVTLTDAEIDFTVDGRLDSPLNEVVAAYVPKFRWSSESYRQLEPELVAKLQSVGKNFVFTKVYNQYNDSTSVVVKGAAVNILRDQWLAAENGDTTKKNRGIVFWGALNPVNITYPVFASAKSVNLVVKYQVTYTYGY